MLLHIQCVKTHCEINKLFVSFRKVSFDEYVILNSVDNAFIVFKTNVIHCETIMSYLQVVKKLKRNHFLIKCS